MLFCAIAGFSRLWIIAQGVKEAAQQAVISTVMPKLRRCVPRRPWGYAAGWLVSGRVRRPLG